MTCFSLHRMTALVLFTCSLSLNAASIALVIDDVGYNPEQGIEALKLPGRVTYAILPGTPHATMLAEMAHAKGKQILVHIPMQSEHHKRLGPEGLTLDMPEAEYKQTVQEAFTTVPYAAGLNNHMGSLLTRHREPMQWLMALLKEKNLLFLDSRTTTETVAEEVARQTGIPAFRRDVFLDNERDPAAIARQFDELIWLAKRRGFATGIGHPYPETLQVIQQKIAELAQQNVELVFLTDKIDTQADYRNTHEGNPPWPMSSSPSPQVVKNLKP